MTEQDIIDRANKLRNMLGGESLPNKVARQIIAIAKVSKSGKVGKFVLPVPTEHAEQCAVIEWCNLHPIAKHIFAIPNGSHKSPAAAIKFKREGLRSGVPDLFLPVPQNGFSGLFIEMKRTKGSVISKEQLAWFELLDKNCYSCFICRGADEAIEAIKSYLNE